ncbi:MAG: hypothetical protein ABSH31_12690 [Bryobacteraceae bacterium]|jgi:hypothetical protein
MFPTTNMGRIVKPFSFAMVAFLLEMAADAAQAPSTAKPRPEAFAPAPSSFLLVMAGFAVLLGWRWWRNRDRPLAKSSPKNGA